MTSLIHHNHNETTAAIAHLNQVVKYCCQQPPKTPPREVECDVVADFDEDGEVKLCLIRSLWRHTKKL
jgi:hypothetical protein